MQFQSSIEIEQANFNDTIKQVKEQECNTFQGLLRGAQRVLKDDALGRLKLIGILHDFDNIKKHIVDVDSSVDSAST